MVYNSWFLGIIFLATGVILYYWKQIKFLWLMLHLPGPTAYPLIGHILLITNHKRLLEFANNGYHLYGPICRIWATIFPMIVVLDPQYIQTILSNPKHTEKIFVYKWMHNFLGKGLVTSTGDQWRSHRKLIQPHFNRKMLDDYVAAFARGAHHLSEKIRYKSRDNNAFDVTRLVNKCIFNILQDVILGIPNDGHEDGFSSFRRAELSLLYRCKHPWLIFDFAYNRTKSAQEEIEQKTILQDLARKILKERKQLGAKSHRLNRCLIDYLLQIEDDSFQINDCINELCTFMLAGQDTVGSALTFTMYYLAKHETIQEKVIEEVDSNLGSSQREVTPVDIGNMKYLEQCVKEALRLCPSIPIIARTLGEDVQLGEHTVPEGTNVLISPLATQRISKYFPNPLDFNPDRFSNGNIENRHLYAYLPFSLGPRNCIGIKFALIELKTVLSTVLRRFRLRLVPGREELSLKYRVTLRSGGGVWLTFVPREDLHLNDT